MNKMAGLGILAALCLMITPLTAKAGGSVSFSVSYSNGDYYPSYFNGVYDYYDSCRTGYIVVEPLLRSYATYYPTYGPAIHEYRSYPRRVTYYCDGPYVYSPIYSRVIIFDNHYRPVYRYSWDYLGYGYTHAYAGTSFSFSYSSPSYYADPWRYKPWYKRYSWDDRRHEFGRDYGRDYNHREPKWYDRTYKQTRDERRRADEIDDRFDDRRDRLQLDRQRLDNDRNNTTRYKSNVDDRDRSIRLPDARVDVGKTKDDRSKKYEAGDSNMNRSRAVLERSTPSRDNSAERARVERERSASTERLRSLQQRSAQSRTQSQSTSRERESTVRTPAPSQTRSSSVERSSSSNSSRGRSDSAVSRTRSAERSRSR